MLACNDSGQRPLFAGLSQFGPSASLAVAYLVSLLTIVIPSILAEHSLLLACRAVWHRQAMDAAVLHGAGLGISTANVYREDFRHTGRELDENWRLVATKRRAIVQLLLLGVLPASATDAVSGSAGNLLLVHAVHAQSVPATIGLVSHSLAPKGPGSPSPGQRPRGN